MHVFQAIGGDTGSVTRCDNTGISSQVGTILPSVGDGPVSAPVLQWISLPVQTQVNQTVNVQPGPKMLHHSALLRCHTDQLHPTHLCCAQYPVNLKKISDDSLQFCLIYTEFCL